MTSQLFILCQLSAAFGSFISLHGMSCAFSVSGILLHAGVGQSVTKNSPRLQAVWSVFTEEGFQVGRG